MTIEIYGSMLCIDHCYPLAKCNLIDKTDLYRYYNWVNFRRMYKNENSSKGTKINPYLYLLQEIKAKQFLKLNEEEHNEDFL